MKGCGKQPSMGIWKSVTMGSNDTESSVTLSVEPMEGRIPEVTLVISEGMVGDEFYAAVAQSVIEPVSRRGGVLFSGCNVCEFHFAFVSATGGPRVNLARLLSLATRSVGYRSRLLSLLYKLKTGGDSVRSSDQNVSHRNKSLFVFSAQITARALPPNPFVSARTSHLEIYQGPI